MSESYFEEGGPFDLRHSGPSEITMKQSIPTDSYGMIARECTNPACTPWYFKVTPGTGIVGGQEFAYCPYCRRPASPSEFLTKDQGRYTIDAIRSEAVSAVDRMFKKALGLGSGARRRIGNGLVSIELAYKSGRRQAVSLSTG